MEPVWIFGELLVFLLQQLFLNQNQNLSDDSDEVDLGKT